MCVYSVDASRTRKAYEGDRLQVFRFPHAVGLTAARNPGHEACCMITGMTALFNNVPQTMQDRFLLAPEAMAKFEEGTRGGDERHDDGFVFVNAAGEGMRIPLEQVPVGTIIDIVPAQTITEVGRTIGNGNAVPVATRRTREMAMTA